MSSTLTVPEVVAGAAVPLGASAVIEPPPGAPAWLQWAVTVVAMVVAPALLKASPQIVAVAGNVATRLLAGWKAKKQALAAAKRARAASDAQTAQRLLADNNADNDAIARAMLESAHKRLDEADALDAGAAQLDAISKPNAKLPEAP